MSPTLLKSVGYASLIAVSYNPDVTHQSKHACQLHQNCSPSPPPPGTSGFYRRTGLPAGDHILRVAAVDPVRNERAAIRNRVRVRATSTFCVVVGTNAGLTVGRSNNVTVEFTSTGQPTGFQCIMDRQEPYFDCKWTCVPVSIPHQTSGQSSSLQKC